ncbi:uncharacterized protein LOC5569528 [Aedes aegypti]|uniref:Uncharacterized protein n=1 Tax=Aedes aegypti TaxID=7159 RepID=A0A6I8TEM1_AEDAE|nr:uncharacterized protein LOC5569528 [Aedes aegypti]
MASALEVILLVLACAVVRGDPFFGNNYQLPQGAALSRYASEVVTNLNNARNSLSSYVRYPPTASPSLNEGAITLRDYVGNVSLLAGGVYSEVSRAATDRTTAPVVVFSKIRTRLNDLQPLLQNGSLYVDTLAANFDSEVDNSTSSYFATWHANLQSDSLHLSTLLQNVSQVIDSVAGQGLNTQQFIAALSADGLLQDLVDAVQRSSASSGHLSSTVSSLVGAINTANSFRSTANSRIQSGRLSAVSTVNSYIASSNASFNSILVATDTLFNHLKTINDSFVFRWPLLLSDRVEQKLDLLNRSIENLIVNLHFRRNVVETHYLVTRLVFANENEPQAYLEGESEQLTRRLVNVIQPDGCASNFRTQFLGLPSTSQSQLTQCINSQLGLERQGASQVLSIANNFLRGYVTAVYDSLEICYSHPFEKMNDCLDDIVETIDFGGKFFLLDTVTFYLFEQVQAELINCHTRLLKYVQNVGLRANCQ